MESLSVWGSIADIAVCDSVGGALIFLFEWFVAGWRVVALVYAAVTVGLFVAIGGMVDRQTGR